MTENGFSLDDLADIEEVPQLRKRYGTLKKAEILITERDERGVFIPEEETHFRFERNIFYRGQLRDGTVVRVAKIHVGASYPGWDGLSYLGIEHAKDIEDEIKGYLDEERKRIKSEYPDVGDILSVRWYSKGERTLPKQFEGERYVNAKFTRGGIVLRRYEG